MLLWSPCPEEEDEDVEECAGGFDEEFDDSMVAVLTAGEEEEFGCEGSFLIAWESRN
jgi:hypothetical protein